jgi:hypothetical protein
MILVDVGIHLQHVQIIRSNIRPESVEKCRDVQNEPICANFRKKAKGIPLDTFFKHRYVFLKQKTAFQRHLIGTAYSIDQKVSK